MIGCERFSLLTLARGLRTSWTSLLVLYARLDGGSRYTPGQLRQDARHRDGTLLFSRGKSVTTYRYRCDMQCRDQPTQDSIKGCRNAVLFASMKLPGQLAIRSHPGFSYFHNTDSHRTNVSPKCHSVMMSQKGLC